MFNNIMSKCAFKRNLESVGFEGDDNQTVMFRLYAELAELQKPMLLGLLQTLSTSKRRRMHCWRTVLMTFRPLCNTHAYELDQSTRSVGEPREHLSAMDDATSQVSALDQSTSSTHWRPSQYSEPRYSAPLDHAVWRKHRCELDHYPAPVCHTTQTNGATNMCMHNLVDMGEILDKCPIAENHFTTVV